MTKIKKGTKLKQFDGSKLRVGIVRTRWNGDIVEQIVSRARRALLDSGVKEKNIVEIEVSGSYELPFAAQHVIRTKKVDVVLPVGCLVKGETMHFEYIAEAVTQGLTRVALDTRTPVIFGVLACLTLEQAESRASTSGKDCGYEWGMTAVEMGTLRKSKG